MSSHVPASVRKQVVARAHSVCEYCLIDETDTFLGCQIEHIVSQKHGGQTALNNLALAYVFCNRFKGSDIATISADTGDLIRLFNPRQDHWAEHFRISRSFIVGSTEIGKATATLLCFNTADRVLEREILIRLERFPSKAALNLIT